MESQHNITGKIGVCTDRLRRGACFVVGLFAAASAFAQTDLDRVGRFHAPAAEHCIQAEMMAIADPHERFLEAFECGDELFATQFNALDGVGARVGDGQRFTRVPRADKTGPGEWANHVPERQTGPNAEACTTCHNLPFEDGAGLAGLNNIRDPMHTNEPGKFINRNTPHVFAPGAVQLLAEEMTTALQTKVDNARAQACGAGGGVSCSVTHVHTWSGGYQVDVSVTNNGATAVDGWSVQLDFESPANISDYWNAVIEGGDTKRVTASNETYNANLGPGESAGFSVQGTRNGGFVAPSCPAKDNGGQPVTVDLIAKGVDFGSVSVPCSGEIDTSGLDGVDSDLVVKPFDWKGTFATVRNFNRDASHQEMGMQPVETTGDGIDGDGDGVVDELGIGDQSALSIYLAAQPRPITQLELNELGLVELTDEEIASIENGETVFEDIGCASCHRPKMVVEDPIFSEPSQHPDYRDAVFPAGQDPLAREVNPADPIAYNLTTDPPSNVVEVNGEEINIGVLEADDRGRAIVRLYGDLKRHDMGPELAENIDAAGVGKSVWITKELWGVGSTQPYLHDGRATTLTEAILAHGGEARQSREAAEALSQSDHEDLIRFLNNLVLFKVEEEEE